MKLNIVTTEPKMVLDALHKMYPQAAIAHTEISSNIHDFEITEGDQSRVYPLEGLMELPNYGIFTYNIRIY